MRVFLLLLASVVVAMADPLTHTFSIVARDPKTGDLGVAVESKYFGVGSVVPWAKAGVGAVATQALAKVAHGPDGLTLIEGGKTAKEALDELLAKDPKASRRQVGMIDAQGVVAVHTGKDCMHWAGHQTGENFSVQGNLLTGEPVVKAMAEAFEKARTDGGEGGLAEWMMAALEAGQAAGGDRRGQQSAALLVVRKGGGPGGDNDRYVDVRVDDHAEPIRELRRLLELQRAFYHRR